jgi:hypothetical protein
VVALAFSPVVVVPVPVAEVPLDVPLPDVPDMPEVPDWS